MKNWKIETTAGSSTNVITPVEAMTVDACVTELPLRVNVLVCGILNVLSHVLAATPVSTSAVPIVNTVVVCTGLPCVSVREPAEGVTNVVRVRVGAKPVRVRVPVLGKLVTEIRGAAPDSTKLPAEGKVAPAGL